MRAHARERKHVESSRAKRSGVGFSAAGHRELGKSVLVGALATLLDLGTLGLLVAGLGWSARLANVPALLVGGAIQLVGNKLFAFEDRSPRWIEQGLGFAAVELVALALNGILFHVLSASMPYVAARLIATFGVYIAFSFPMWTRIFAPAEDPSG